MEPNFPFLEHAPLIGLFVLLLLGGVGLPFPEDATLILGGVLISQKAVSPVPALVTLYAGVLTADVLLYHVGRRYGRNIVTHRRFRRLLPPARFERLEERFRRNAFLFVLLGRHVAGLRAQVFLVAGTLGMRLTTFFAADALSSLASVGVLVAIGYFGGHSLEIFRKDVSRVEHAAVVIVVAMLTAYLLSGYFRSRRGPPQ
jgi:membrane protein DedA with SNARE-associated domain